MSGWNDLNTLTAPSAALGHYGVHDPINAWPGAAADVIVWLNFVGDDLVQHGHDVGSTDRLWSRRRLAAGGPWAQWTLQTEADQGVGVIRGVAQFQDGIETVELPDYVKLTCFAIAGTAAAIETGDLRMAQSGEFIVEIRTNVMIANGSHVIFGGGRNGAAAQELKRIQVNSTERTLVLARFYMTLNAGDLLALYLSSDSPAPPLEWRGTETIFVLP